MGLLSMQGGDPGPSCGDGGGAGSQAGKPSLCREDPHGRSTASDKGLGRQRRAEDPGKRGASVSAGSSGSAGRSLGCQRRAAPSRHWGTVKKKKSGPQAGAIRVKSRKETQVPSPELKAGRKGSGTREKETQGPKFNLVSRPGMSAETPGCGSALGRAGWVPCQGVQWCQPWADRCKAGGTRLGGMGAGQSGEEARMGPGA